MLIVDVEGREFEFCHSQDLLPVEIDSCILVGSRRSWVEGGSIENCRICFVVSTRVQTFQISSLTIAQTPESSRMRDEGG